MIFCINVNSQSVTWEKLYGYPNSDEGAYDVCESGDGSFFIVGSSGHNFVNTRVYVLKINQYGDTLWTKKYNIGHYAYTTSYSGDCGCVMTGYGIDSLYALKIDCDGNIMWQKFYPTGAICFDISKVSDGGYILCGYNLFKGYFMKIDSLGNMEWEKNYMVSNQMGFSSCIEAIDGGYITAGYVIDPDTLKIILIKTNIEGDSLWEQRYKILNERAALTSIQRNNNNYLISGTSRGRIYFSRISINGAQEFSYLFPSENIETIYDSRIINPNRFVMTSEYYPLAGDTSFVINRICDSSGNIINQRYFSSSGYISMQTILPLASGDILFAGINKPVQGSNDDYAYIVRTDSTLFSKPLHVNQTSNLIPSYIRLYQNYPNPFNPETKINFTIPKDGKVTLKIYDILGKEVKTLVNEFRNSGSYQVTFSGINLSSGVYYYKIEAGRFTQVRKMVLLK